MIPRSSLILMTTAPHQWKTNAPAFFQTDPLSIARRRRAVELARGPGTPFLCHVRCNQTLTAHATVKELQWGNPHTWLELMLLEQDGTAKSLSLELNGISGLRRVGWKPTTLKPDDKVTVTYHPMRDGTAAGQLVQLVTEDGETLKGQ